MTQHNFILFGNLHFGCIEKIPACLTHCRDGDGSGSAYLFFMLHFFFFFFRTGKPRNDPIRRHGWWCSGTFNAGSYHDGRSHSRTGVCSHFSPQLFSNEPAVDHMSQVSEPLPRHLAQAEPHRVSHDHRTTNNGGGNGHSQRRDDINVSVVDRTAKNRSEHTGVRQTGKSSQSRSDPIPTVGEQSCAAQRPSETFAADG